MKILFYMNCLTHGGAERVISNLANSFSREHQCVMVTSYPVDNEYTLCNGIKRVYLSNNREQFFLIRNIKLINGLRKTIKKEKPNVIVSFMAEPNFRLLLASLFNKRVKKVVSVRNDPAKEYSSLFSRFLAKSLFKTANCIVFQTDDARSFFSSNIAKKSVILPNAVESSFFSKKYTGKRKNIVSVGRLTEQKNFGLLISAFADLSELIDDDLIIYGDGPERQTLERIIIEKKLESRVTLPGVVNNIADVIKSAKLFVLPSNYEGLPNALMEAMALGIPSISTNCPCGGPKMLIENEVNGILVPVGDKEFLKSAILNVLSGNYPHIGDKAFESMAIYKPDVVFHKWNELLIRLASNERENK